MSNGTFREFDKIHPINDRKDFHPHPRPRIGKTRYDRMPAKERMKAKEQKW